MTSREVRKFVYQAIRRGVDIRHLDGAGHWAVYHQGRRVGSIAYSPRDGHWRDSAIGLIRRSTGVDLRSAPRKPKRNAQPRTPAGSDSTDPDRT